MLLSSSLSVGEDIAAEYPWCSRVAASVLRLGGRAGGSSVCSICLKAECSRYAGLAKETGGGVGVDTAWLERCL